MYSNYPVDQLHDFIDLRRRNSLLVRLRDRDAVGGRCMGLETERRRAGEQGISESH